MGTKDPFHWSNTWFRRHLGACEQTFGGGAYEQTFGGGACEQTFGGGACEQFCGAPLCITSYASYAYVAIDYEALVGDSWNCNAVLNYACGERDDVLVSVIFGYWAY